MVFKDQEPDRLEKGIRFGCGTLFGLLLGLFLTRRLWFDDTSIALLGAIAVAVVCGGLASRHGDRFWSRFRGDDWS